MLFFQIAAPRWEPLILGEARFLLAAQVEHLLLLFISCFGQAFPAIFAILVLTATSALANVCSFEFWDV